MNRDDQNDLEFRTPARFVEALSSLQKETVFVPPAVDEAVLVQARARLAGVRQSRAQSRMTARW